jgi:hypothetical protein
LKDPFLAKIGQLQTPCPALNDVIACGNNGDRVEEVDYNSISIIYDSREIWDVKLNFF